MEQASLYEDLASRATGFTPWDNTLLDITTPPMLLCPSDVAKTRTSTGNHARVPGNLMISLGDISTVINNDTSTNADGVSSGRLLFYRDEEKSFAFCTDGLSNTVIISESIVSESLGNRNIKGGIGVTNNIDQGSWTWDPSPCKNATSDGRTLNSTVTVSTNAWRGGRMFDWRLIYSHFHTILPPNSPSCYCNLNADVETADGYFTATSNHPGGVNAGRLDGSVSFITNTVDTNGLPAAKQGRFFSGESPYGVWGAMGSPNGGENVAP